MRLQSNQRVLIVTRAQADALVRKPLAAMDLKHLGVFSTLEGAVSLVSFWFAADLQGTKHQQMAMVLASFGRATDGAAAVGQLQSTHVIYFGDGDAANPWKVEVLEQPVLCGLAKAGCNRSTGRTSGIATIAHRVGRPRLDLSALTVNRNRLHDSSSGSDADDEYDPKDAQSGSDSEPTSDSTESLGVFGW